MAECTVTIQNNSGMNQNYIFFADAPDVQGARNISQCVYIAQRAPQGGSIQVRLKAASEAFSCSKHGNQVMVQDLRRIKLADKDGNGGSIISFDGGSRDGRDARPFSFGIECRSEGVFFLRHIRA